MLTNTSVERSHTTSWLHAPTYPVPAATLAVLTIGTSSTSPSDEPPLVSSTLTASIQSSGCKATAVGAYPAAITCAIPFANARGTESAPFACDRTPVVLSRPFRLGGVPFPASIWVSSRRRASKRSCSSTMPRISSTSLSARRVAGAQLSMLSTGESTCSNGSVASGFVPVVVLVASETSTATDVYVV